MQTQTEKNRPNEHQTVLLSMLKDLDAVCQEHNIHYQLFAGTALGAVRHQGFVPWDDDIDVIMLREEYERFFREAAPDLDPERYFVQKEFTEHWPMQFSKLRLNGTACIEKFHAKDALMHQGVGLDIFPCDNLAKGEGKRRLQFLASKVVIAKALYTRGYETNSLVKKVFMQGCRILPSAPFRKMVVRAGEKNSGMVHSFFGCGSKYEKNIFPREWMEETVMMPFEDGTFPVTAHYDELLTKLYGDYRTLPKPEEIKKKEHVAILDLHRPYTEYLEQQQTMEIHTLTRSIR